jgi:hypothetical protein
MEPRAGCANAMRHAMKRGFRNGTESSPPAGLVLWQDAAVNHEKNESARSQRRRPSHRVSNDRFPPIARQKRSASVALVFDACRQFPASGLYEQFAGFHKLEPIDLSAYAHRTAPMDVVLGRERTQRTQVVKQADVVSLIALLPREFPGWVCLPLGDRAFSRRTSRSADTAHSLPRANT